MADTKISALTAANTPLTGTEVVPIVQSSVTKQVAVSDIGTKDHTALSNLAWASSGHTGTASNFAAFSGAGAADEITATEATALLNAFAGDSGAGGTKGLVPAPAAGDAAAGKYLDSDGTWTVPPSGGASPYTIESKTAGFTVVAGDFGKIFHCSSAAFTVALTAAATLGSGFYVNIVNTSDTRDHSITIDPNGSETIDGKTTWILRCGEGMQIYCNGTNWEVGNHKALRTYAENSAKATARPIALGSDSIAIGTGGNTSTYGSSSIAIFGTCSQGNGVVIGVGCSANGGSTGVNGNVAIGRSSTITITAYRSVAIGDANTTNSNFSLAIGRSNTIASGTYSACVGDSNSIAGSNSNVFGTSCLTSYASGFACGLYSTSSSIGKYAYSNGRFAANADSQYGLYILRIATIDETSTVITTDAAAAGSTNLVTLPNNGAFAMRGLVIGRKKVSEADEVVMFEFSGLARRGANAASTAIVGTITPTQTAADAALSGCTLTVTADTTNGGVALTVAGIAATNIRWTAVVHTSEVIYA